MKENKQLFDFFDPLLGKILYTVRRGIFNYGWTNVVALSSVENFTEWDISL